MSSSPQSTTNQVISVLGRPVVLAVANEPQPCNAVYSAGNAGRIPVGISSQQCIQPIPVKIYTDETVDDSESIRTLIIGIRAGFPGSHIHILRDIMIAKSYWEEDGGAAIHIVFSRTPSDGMIVLANKLLTKYGVRNVIFVAYDLNESDRLHLEEAAVWVYATVCNHPTSIDGLSDVLRGMNDNCIRSSIPTPCK